MFLRVDLYSYSIWAVYMIRLPLLDICLSLSLFQLRHVEIDFDKMKEATNHAKAIRRAARRREKYSLQDEFEEKESTVSLMPIEEDLPQKVTSRHTMGNVLDLFTQRDKQPAIADLTDDQKLSSPRRRVSVVSTVGSPKGLELQSHKLDEFIAKREAAAAKGGSGNGIARGDLEMGECKPDLKGRPMTIAEDKGDHQQDEEEDTVMTREELDELTNPNDIFPPILYQWIGTIVENLSLTGVGSGTNIIKSVGGGGMDSNSEEFNPARVRAGTLDKLDHLMYTSRLKFKCLEFFMESLEKIVITPMVYLCKGLDPIALNMALEYVARNELTSNIIVLHIVDDRPVIHSHHRILKRLQSLGMDEDGLRSYHRRLLVQHMTGEMKEKLKGSTSLEKKKTVLSVTDVHEVEYELEPILGNLPEGIQSLPKLVSLFDTLYMFVTLLLTLPPLSPSV
jgi:hypothetical protein